MDSTWSGRSEEDIQCYLVDETTPCASIEARTLKIRDRRAFSRIAFQPGQVLFRNSPYTLVPHRSKDFCSACFGPAPQKRCSQCLKAWYCSKACQVKDFPLHRIECREHPLLWSHLEMDDIEWQRNARLILRTYLRLQTMCQKTSHCQRINSGAGYYSCSGQHFQQLEATKKPLDTVELASIHVVKQVLRQKKIRSLLKKYYNISETASNDHQLGVDVENILRRFSVNNFGVVDDMMSVTGSGVYPLAALLNHSCAPNCFLRYTRDGVLEVVAAVNIEAGTELTHSYVDLVSTTDTRRQQLQTTYGFHCTCARCLDRKVSLPSTYLNSKADDVIDWVLDTYCQPTQILSTRSDSSDQAQFDLDRLLRPPLESTTTVTPQVQNLQHKAHLAMANDDVDAELSLLSEAIELLLTTTHAPFSLDLYQVRCQRLSSWIVAQQTAEALRDCRHVVAVLCLALSHVPCHPLLGLQLFTLGDLYEACGLVEQGRKTHLWARRALSTSLGSDNPMVQMLNDKIS